MQFQGEKQVCAQVSPQYGICLLFIDSIARYLIIHYAFKLSTWREIQDGVDKHCAYLLL